MPLPQGQCQVRSIQKTGAASPGLLCKMPGLQESSRLKTLNDLSTSCLFSKDTPIRVGPLSWGHRGKKSRRHGFERYGMSRASIVDCEGLKICHTDRNRIAAKPRRENRRACQQQPDINMKRREIGSDPLEAMIVFEGSSAKVLAHHAGSWPGC
jgi:hypothetical protein